MCLVPSSLQRARTYSTQLNPHDSTAWFTGCERRTQAPQRLCDLPTVTEFPSLNLDT